MRKRSDRPEPVQLITGAEPSQAEQLHSRQTRYLLMMGLRLVCLLTAAVAYSRKVTWVIPICIVGMLVLPWMAVLIANDRPPLKASRFRRVTVAPPQDRAVEGPVTGSPPARVIDQ